MEIKNKLFIHKYQPIYFNDFGMDPDILDILKTLIQMDNLNILLIGDVASGKTSLLNSLIREYYTGYNEKDYEENVLFINSLKEQGINYYRSDVKTFCQTCSNIKNKKKFVVLDDIGLINEQSQQVFRNCIDKFSHNVHFISSCNNIQKVIESLQSRFNIIKMKPLKKENLITVINKIKTNENIIIDPDAEELIINISNYSIKTLINYMEKFKLLGENITYSLALQLCSNISFLTFEEYTNFIINKNRDMAVKLIYEIYDKGYSVMDILDNYFLFIKSSNLLNEEQKYAIIPNICKYITIFHNIHEEEIELALFTNNLIDILSLIKI
jgi:DNA polymerase III delta prime subunit